MRRPSQHEILGWMIIIGVPLLLVVYLISIAPVTFLLILVALGGVILFSVFIRSPSASANSRNSSMGVSDSGKSSSSSPVLDEKERFRLARSRVMGLRARVKEVEVAFGRAERDLRVSRSLLNPSEGRLRSLLVVEEAEAARVRVADAELLVERTSRDLAESKALLAAAERDLHSLWRPEDR